LFSLVINHFLKINVFSILLLKQWLVGINYRSHLFLELVLLYLSMIQWKHFLLGVYHDRWLLKHEHWFQCKRYVVRLLNNIYLQIIVRIWKLLPTLIASTFSILAYRNVRRILQRQTSHIQRPLDLQLTAMVLARSILFILVTPPFSTFLIFSYSFYREPSTHSFFHRQVKHVIFRKSFRRFRWIMYNYKLPHPNQVVRLPIVSGIFV
jgi:hypothetical protein